MLVRFVAEMKPFQYLHCWGTFTWHHVTHYSQWLNRVQARDILIQMAQAIGTHGWHAQHHLPDVHFRQCDMLNVFIGANTYIKNQLWYWLCSIKITCYTLLTLLVIFKQSLEKGLLPNDWKVGKGVPLHKCSDKSPPLNYLLISLASISRNIMEHIICTHLFEFRKSNSFFIIANMDFLSHSLVKLKLYMTCILALKVDSRQTAIFLISLKRLTRFLTNYYFIN